jgi:hypothetical protein
MSRWTDPHSAKAGVYPRVPLMRTRWRASFGLAALFGLVTIAAVIAGAAKMPGGLGVSFAADVWLAAAGVYQLRVGWRFRRQIDVRSDALVCAWVYFLAGAALLAFAVATFALGLAGSGHLL